MKVKQKVVFNIGTPRFAAELQEYLNDGWRVVPATIVRGIGDYQLCVVQRDIPETLPSPCFNPETPEG